MTARRGALAAVTGAALLLLAALASCRLAHKESRWSQAVWGWAQLAEAQAAAWWATHRPAAVATWPVQPPAAVRANPPGFPRQPAEPLTVMLQLPGQRGLQLREDETLESLVAKLLQEQAGLHPTAIELISVEQVTQRRTSPIRAVLRAVAALRQPSAQHAAAVEGADVAALTADPALQQLAAGGSPAVRLLSDAGSVDSSKRAVRAIKDGRRDLKNGRKLRQQMQELDQAARQLEHPYMKLFGPARSADSPAEEPASAQQAAAADVQQSIIVVEVTLVGQEGSAQQPLLPLLQGLGSRLGSPTSGRAASEANAEVAAAGTAAADSRWSMAAHLANVEEYLQSLLPAQPAQQHSQPRQQHRHAHSRSHVQHPWVQEGVALPTRPPLSPLKLAALDTVFVAATVVALVCSVLLAADIMRYGLWPQQATAASHGSGYPAGALVAVGPAEQQPMLIVVAADEVAAAQQAGYTKL